MTVIRSCESIPMSVRVTDEHGAKEVRSRFMGLTERTNSSRKQFQRKTRRKTTED
jgi:hypothetical protein